jgi:hypothetical protein
MRIPMKGTVGSLNAAVAGSILLFEALAQRDDLAGADKPEPVEADVSATASEPAAPKRRTKRASAAPAKTLVDGAPEADLLPADAAPRQSTKRHSGKRATTDDTTDPDDPHA